MVYGAYSNDCHLHEGIPSRSLTPTPQVEPLATTLKICSTLLWCVLSNIYNTKFVIFAPLIEYLSGVTCELFYLRVAIFYYTDSKNIVYSYDGN